MRSSSPSPTIKSPASTPPISTPPTTTTTIDSTTLHYRLLTLLKQYDNRLCADCREVLVVQHHNHHNNNSSNNNNEHKDGFLNDCIYASLTYGVIPLNHFCNHC